ncbi:MAG: hypothetical protein ACOYOU_02910 [Kiritimatiellia bacterium]
MDTIINTTTPDGADMQPLSETEIVRLTDETVSLLLNKQDLKTEVEIWVRRGIVIRKFVRKLQPNGKFTKPDPYTLLSEHPDICWSARYLRQFVDALELWELFGEGQPSLPVKFYIIVASCKGSFDEKKALLKKVVEQHLSISALKRELAASETDAEGDACGEGQKTEGPTEGTSCSTEKPAGDWKKVESYAEKLNIELSAVDISGMASLKIISKLMAVAAQIQDLLKRFNKGRST